MTIIIEINTQEVTNKSGHSQRSGKAYSINEQTAYMHKPGQPYPEKIKVTLSDNKPAYPMGNYDLHPDSFGVDRYGQITVRPILIPRPAEMKKAG